MRKRLNLERRKLIEEHLSSGWCLRRIASALCVVASGVSREVSRHGGAAVYRAGVAQERAARMRAGVGHHRIHHSPPDQGGLGAHARQRGKPCLSRAERRAQAHSEPRPFFPAPAASRRPGARHDPREKVGANVSRANARHRRAHQPAPDENPPMAIPKPSRQTIITPPGGVALSMTMCINPRPAQDRKAPPPLNIPRNSKF